MNSDQVLTALLIICVLLVLARLLLRLVRAWTVRTDREVIEQHFEERGAHVDAVYPVTAVLGLQWWRERRHPSGGRLYLTRIRTATGDVLEVVARLGRGRVYVESSPSLR